MGSIEILGVKIDDLDFVSVVSTAEELCEKPGLSTIFTPKPMIINTKR